MHKRKQTNDQYILSLANDWNSEKVLQNNQDCKMHKAAKKASLEGSFTTPS